MRCGFIAVNIKTDNVFCSPTTASPFIGVHSPIPDALFQYDVGIALLKSEVHILVAEGETRQNPMVTANDDVDGAVRTVVGVTHWIGLVFIGLETEFVQTLLQTLMQRHGIGTKRHYLTFVVNLKVEMFAREIVVVVGVLVLQAIGLFIPSATLRLVAFGSGKGFCRCADVDGSTWYVVSSFTHFLYAYKYSFMCCLFLSE